MLADAYELVADYEAVDPALPLALFGVAVDAKFHDADSAADREKFAYEVLLNKFDVMLKNSRVSRGRPNRGLVIHDRRVVVERDIQGWTAQWRTVAGNVGQLRNLADVPLFADSRATRLLQVADLVSYAIFRRYSPGVTDYSYFERIWSKFHTEDGVVHGCVHFSPSYGQGNCVCEACQARLTLQAGRPRHARRRRAAGPAASK